MKVLILAGGFGTRLNEETRLKPKPMVEIGGIPVLEHIMNIYSANGFNEFVILLGYKGHIIKEHFANYYLRHSSVTIDLKSNKVETHNNLSENWKVTLLDTGLHTMTGGRIKRAKEFIGNEPFLCTYGDGVGDINIKEVVEFHKSNNKLMTLTAIQPLGRYGILNIQDDLSVAGFNEKPKDDNRWVNGGFFVCEPEVLDYIDGDHQMLEREPMEKIAKDNQMQAFKHTGFWHAMDTLRDNQDLNKLWDSGNAPWKIW
ncbi:glucose-1-phosphate cytidylyltransferase [Tamlana sedimentorum]|uniref:Glucose-1-phosphate cytidylyltransferase n=1 Tax=Neotamlana sedimentorum TaxID=1435349 RepID=A0A0D7W728_9FLAO|nr:glucose-1-phosphate cytidylyltransferase [Tamlana sedimentorum]KJD34920.1 glucose-1-phosphate cytidylyltransferase [Tamlana sedimentorum]